MQNFLDSIPKIKFQNNSITYIPPSEVTAKDQMQIKSTILAIGQKVDSSLAESRNALAVLA